MSRHCTWDCSKYRERPDPACYSDELQLCLTGICTDESHPDRGELPPCTMPTDSRAWWTPERVGALVLRGAECTATVKLSLF